MTLQERVARFLRSFADWLHPPGVEVQHWQAPHDAFVTIDELRSPRVQVDLDVSMPDTGGASFFDEDDDFAAVGYSDDHLYL